MHKHKICGSDGKLYSSRCHLRRAACESNTFIRPAHPDQCLRDEENEEDEATEQVDVDTLDNRINQVDHDPPAPTAVITDTHPLDYSEEDECRPKDYDLMKEKVLNKSECKVICWPCLILCLNFSSQRRFLVVCPYG